MAFPWIGPSFSCGRPVLDPAGAYISAGHYGPNGWVPLPTASHSTHYVVNQNMAMQGISHIPRPIGWYKQFPGLPSSPSSPLAAFERLEALLPMRYRYPCLGSINAPSARTLAILGPAAGFPPVDQSTVIKQELRYEVLRRYVPEFPWRPFSLPPFPQGPQPNQQNYHPLPRPPPHVLYNACRWASGYPVQSTPPIALQMVMHSLLIRFFPAWWYRFEDGYERPEHARFVVDYLMMLRSMRISSCQAMVIARANEENRAVVEQVMRDIRRDQGAPGFVEQAE